jgi:hypothetical protein
MSDFNYIVKICKKELNILPAERNGKLVDSKTGKEIIIENIEEKIMHNVVSLIKTLKKRIQFSTMVKKRKS